MREPRNFARDVSQFAIPDGSGDRFSGYGVIGLPFSSGHVLALRCFEVSSLGTAYTSVWHRDPKGRWTFHQNVPPEQSCPRYFGAAITENTTEPPNRLDAPAPVLRHGRRSGRDCLGHPARADACNQDNERGRERDAFLVVGEAVRVFNNGDRCTMDTEDRQDEPDRLHSEWAIFHGDSAIDLAHRGEPGDDSRGRCGRAGTASETSDAGRLLCTATRNLRHLHLSLGRSVERRSKRLRRAAAWAT